MSGPKTLLRRLRRSVSGLAMTEFALSLPLMLTAGLWGVELANYGVTMMRVNQLAIHMADNASRIGDTSMLANRKIYEADIMDLLQGAHIQGGKHLNFFDHGRAIISSLQVDPVDPDGELQYIHWQRCLGEKVWTSTYGDVDDRLASGMGPAGREVIAFADEAVMFVELAYEYQPLISKKFVGEPVIKSVASFTVRSDRDLSGIFQRDDSAPDPVADCSNYTNPFGPLPDGGAGGDGGGSTSTTSGGTSTSTTSGGTSTSTTSGGTSTTSGGSSSWGGGGRGGGGWGGR